MKRNFYRSLKKKWKRIGNRIKKEAREKEKNEKKGKE